MATIDDVMKVLRDIKDLITWLPERVRVASNQIMVTSLSEISETLGTIRAGEFRAGNGKDPGQGFTGIRILWPGAYYNDQEWYLVTAEDDELQVGIGAEDGIFVAGEGNVTLSKGGIIIKGTSQLFTLQDADGNQVGAIYVDGAGNLAIELQGGGDLTVHGGDINSNDLSGTGDARVNLQLDTVTKGILWYDRSSNNLVLEHETSGGAIVFNLADATGFFNFYDADGNTNVLSISGAGVVTAKEQASDPGNPAAGDRSLYAKSDGWYELDSAGASTKLSGTTPDIHVDASTTGAETVATGIASAEIIEWDSAASTVGIELNSEDFTQVVTATAGRFLVSALVGWTANNTGNRRLRLLKNGTAFAVDLRKGTDTNNTQIGLSHVVSLAVGDYIQVEVAQTSGGDLNLLAGAALTVQLLAK
jgi:hypothetical protein